MCHQSIKRAKNAADFSEMMLFSTSAVNCVLQIVLDLVLLEVLLCRISDEYLWIHSHFTAALPVKLYTLEYNVQERSPFTRPLFELWILGRYLRQYEHMNYTSNALKAPDCCLLLMKSFVPPVYPLPPQVAAADLQINTLWHPGWCVSAWTLMNLVDEHTENKIIS